MFMRNLTKQSTAFCIWNLFNFTLLLWLPSLIFFDIFLFSSLYIYHEEDIDSKVFYLLTHSLIALKLIFFIIVFVYPFSIVDLLNNYNL